MGKGKTSSSGRPGLGLLPDLSGEAKLLELRGLWVSQLHEQLGGLLEAAELIDEQPALQALNLICFSYQDGDYPQHFMDAFLADFRVVLAGCLDKEERVEAAARMLQSPDLRPAQAARVLVSMISNARERDHASLYRSALAEVQFNNAYPRQAAEPLLEDLRSPGISERYRRLAEAKLEALAELSDPVCWEEQLVPPEVREGMNLNDWWRMTGVGLGGPGGLEAGVGLARALVRHGYYRKAFELTDRLEAHQDEPEGVEAALALRCEVARAAGWPDCAMWVLPPDHPARADLLRDFALDESV